MAELATPLLTMYEMWMYGTVGMTTHRLHMERDAFYFTLEAILDHPDNKECSNQYRLLYWRDPGYSRLHICSNWMPLESVVPSLDE